MIRFILNDKEVISDLPSGELLLDYIRYHKNLTGTKIGCREGDCGACTVLVGELKNDEVIYRSATSCLMALGNANGKHIVTVEGVNFDNELNPVQHAMSEEGATQCGFCTPGFVVSLAGFCLSKKDPVYENAVAAVNGNICRCTGYKSIEKAAGRVSELMQQRKDADVISFVTEQRILPAYFADIKERLTTLQSKTNGIISKSATEKFLGGGTDLYVQQHETMVHTDINFLSDKKELKGIIKEGNRCVIGASATVTDIIESQVFHDSFPDIFKFIKLVSSTQIRNMATVAGNFVNASPIGDLTIFFLALDATLVLSTEFENGKQREIKLRDFYKGYKQLDKLPGEIIQNIWFELPDKNTHFNFEKVSKRTHLDIATVNSALQLKTESDLILKASLSAGGVGPIPMYLKKTSEYLDGKKITSTVIEEAIQIAQTEVSPISDARGSEAYKRLLLTQLIKAHFHTFDDSII